MTSDRLAQIEERLAAVTVGEWGLFTDNTDEWTVDRVSVDDDDLGMEIAVGSSRIADGRFIAEARQDIPWLLAELAAARQQLAAGIELAAQYANTPQSEGFPGFIERQVARQFLVALAVAGGSDV